MNILFVGPIWRGSNATSLARGFREIGHGVTVLDTSGVNQLQRFSADWAYNKAFGRRRPNSIREVIDAARRAAVNEPFDALIAYKTVHLPQAELLDLPIPIKIHYSPDDVANPDNTTGEYFDFETHWDIIVTTKRHNVPEIAARGARPLFVWSAYDDAWHRPSPRSVGRDFVVGFIGAWRAGRDELLRRLVLRYGYQLRLAGPRWSGRHWSRASLSGPVYGEDFSVAVAETRCNLVLLNSDNRDQHTCRSFEIPASRGLFVGERTSEHQEILDEGTESLLFSSEDELLEILDWCAGNRKEISIIRDAGYRRITEGRNTYAARAGEILEAIE